MDLSSASDQPSGVRRRLSSRKAAQLRSLFCSGTPTARLETESDDAVLLHRKISRSEGRIAAVHPPAPRRKRKKSVIIIPLPAACIVSSSIIFFLLFPLFLASVSEAAQRHLSPTSPDVYMLEKCKFFMIFGKTNKQYDPDLHVKTIVPLIQVYNEVMLKHLVKRAKVNEENLSKVIEYATQLAEKNAGTAVKLETETIKNLVESPELSKNIREVRAIVPSREVALKVNVGPAILILWDPSTINPKKINQQLGVVLVFGKPTGWDSPNIDKRQIAVKVLAKNALTLVIEHNRDMNKNGEMDMFIKVFVTHPILGMPLETMKGYMETHIPTMLRAPVIDFLDKRNRFFPALKEISSESGEKIKKLEISRLKSLFMGLKTNDEEHFK